MGMGSSPEPEESWGECLTKTRLRIALAYGHRAALDFDHEFLRALGLGAFNPKTQKASDLDIVFTLGRPFGPGITRAQFKQIIRRCSLCHNVCLRERRHSHRCRGPALLSQADGFSLIDSLLTYDEHAGLSFFDLSRLLIRCGRCHHICLEGTLIVHDCIGSQ